MSAFDHTHLLTIMEILPTDYSDYGGSVERWSDPNQSYPDCSCGCKWAAWLEGDLSSDWCVCTNKRSPRSGLLTFEHLAGFDSFEPDPADEY